MRARSLFVSIIIGFFIIASFAIFSYIRLRRIEVVRNARLNAKAEEVKVRVIEGWTENQIAEYLSSKSLVQRDVFLSVTKTFKTGDYPLLASRPASASLEGFLFPDTYRLPVKPTAEDVVVRMLNNFTLKFKSVSGKPLASGGFEVAGYGALGHLSVYELVTLASIVEKETGQDLSAEGAQAARIAEERKVVAGIFYNRLLANMGLESDATINYITGKNLASASGKDIAIDSAYNTYKYNGLPPGPIANPSLTSLDAVLHPIKTDYYYFLHKQPSGEVVYSKTFEEHVKNKRLYLQ